MNFFHRDIEKVMRSGTVYLVDGRGSVTPFPESLYERLPTEIVDQYAPFMSLERAEAYSAQKKKQS